MKKLISVVLCALLLLACAPVAFAAGGCDCGKAPIIHVYGLGNQIYQGDAVVFPPSKDTIMGVVKNAVPLTPGLLIGKLNDKQQEKFLDTAKLIFDPIAFDENGDPRNGVTAHFTYPTSEDHKNGSFIGFDYDWRVDPFVTAAQLHDFIGYVKEMTGHDSVYLVGESMGTVIMNTYLSAYGFDGVEGVVWYNGAYNCVESCSDSFANKNNFEAAALTRFLKQLAVRSDNPLLFDLFTALDESGLMDEVFGSVLQTADDLNASGRFARFLNECLGTMPGFWALVSAENFDAAVEFAFPTPELKAKNAVLIERITRYHNEVGARVDDIMAEAQAATGKVGIVAGYGSVLPPVTADNLQQSDSVIGTADESNGATCAPYGSCFPADYVQKNTACGHNHISADREIDASTGFFPENTWYVKYGNHQIGSYAKTLVNKIFFEEGFNVHSDPAFPQFLLRDEATNTASPLTEENCADITGAPRFTAKLFGVFFKGFARLLALCKTVSGWFNK